MDINTLIVFLAIGAVAGWIAGQIVKGGGFGLVGDIVIGVLGAFIGGHILGWFGMTGGGLLGAIISAVIGAVVLLYVIRLIKRS